MGNTESSFKEDFCIGTTDGMVHEDWNISQGKFRDSVVTIFSAQHPPSSRKRPFLEQALQASKVYRHPGILRFLDGGVSSETEIFIVTEEATPLCTHNIEKMPMLQIAAGLSSIIEAISFLHDKGGVSHNNVQFSSIYLTTEGSWKLWNFEYMCSFSEISRGHLDRISPYLNAKFFPTDKRISAAYQHARDCYSFGKFIRDDIIPLLDSGDNVVKELQDFVEKKVLKADWSERPRVHSLLQLSFFQSEFLKLRNDLINILLQPPLERDSFIKSLPESLKQYSEEVVAETLSPLLLNHSFFLIPASTSCLMPHLLTPRQEKNGHVGLFSPRTFCNFILPRVLQLFLERDLYIRGVLLRHLHQFVFLVPKKSLTDFVLPELLLGIRDSNEDLVAETLRCLALLVPILGADVVVGRRRKQIFSAATPRIGQKSRMESKSRSARSKESVEHHVAVPSENIPQSVSIVPERSSPDGGEVFIHKGNAREGTDSCSSVISGLIPDDDHWSDWEDSPRHSSRSPFSIPNNAPANISRPRMGEEQESCDSRLQPLPYLTHGSSAIKHATSSPVSLSNKSTEIIDNTPRETTLLPAKSNILLANDDHLATPEFDLLAELAPRITLEKYNLESMLSEASLKSKASLLHETHSGDAEAVRGSDDERRRDSLFRAISLSTTLADMHCASMENEGDEWNEDLDWSSSDDFLRSE